MSQVQFETLDQTPLSCFKCWLLGTDYAAIKRVFYVQMARNLILKELGLDIYRPVSDYPWAVAHFRPLIRG